MFLLPQKNAEAGETVLEKIQCVKGFKIFLILINYFEKILMNLVTFVFSVRVSALDNLHVSRLALGMSHSLVLHRGGEIYSWGDNSRGQLGRAAVDDDEWWRIPK